MAAPTIWARCSRCGKSRVSWTFAAEGTTPSGRPSVATTTWYLVPALPRSVGLGPVSSPPRLARTEQLSTTTSQAAASGPARTIRTRATRTRRSRAVALQPSRRRRGGPPPAGAAAGGGAAGAPGGAPQLPPLHALADEGAQRPDDLDGRQGCPAGPVRPAPDPVDDPRHQLRRPRRHARLPVPEARETSAGGAGCRQANELRRSGNRPLLSSGTCRPGAAAVRSPGRTGTHSR